MAIATTINKSTESSTVKSGAGFTHLHVHSHYSLLDGLSKIDELVSAAKSMGLEALALTDHGVMYGTIPFYNLCLEAGIKPIVGLEAYIAPRGLQDKSGKVDADYYHLTLLAANDDGYKNLLKLTTIAHLEGFYYKPRIDLETLKKHSSGLIALSGCQRGELAKAVMSKSEAEIKSILEKYLEIFGRDGFYIEIQRNSRKRDPAEEMLNQKLIALAAKENLKPVATADSHYIHEDDSEAQDVLICIGTGRTVNEADRMDMRGYDLSLKTAEQMAEKFQDLPEAISNTAEIADKCHLKILTNQRYFPHVEVPPGKTAAEYLRELTYSKSLSLYGNNGIVPDEVQKRIDYELDIIIKTGFDTYILMVADVVEGAHKLGAVTNTRGSAAGSIVGRILGITNVDPLYYELPFERFLTEYRPTPPDIDLDIADNHRDETIAYITKKYGQDKVAQIITFGTMMARAAVRDVGRALGVPYTKCDQIAKMIPFGKQGFHMTLDKAIEINPDLKSAYEKDPETKKILEIAKKLEGGARHASVHAAGVVITPTPLTDYMPLQHEPDGHRIITQYDMYSLDVNAAGPKAIGVVKLDLLGIRNLSILEAAVKLTEKRHGVKIDIYNLPHPDKKTFKLLSEGHTFGVFQMGSSGMTRYLMDLKPNSIFDIMAMIALYRPGPMQFIPEYIKRKHNQKLIRYQDPALEKILHRTYGILVYQDDLLTIAHDLAGYTWEEVDKFRKAVGKKIPAEMAKQKEKFIEGCVQTSGWNKQKASEIWEWIEPFAAYGFNKSHSASYCVVSYQTAYMKANFPVEFMAAVLTAESGDMDTIAEAVEECRILGINVLPPDVNESMSQFTVIDEHNIRFGLYAIKNLGQDVIEMIREQRKTGEKFHDVEDFVKRTQNKNFNKKSWEALVKSGALDSLGERNQLLASTEMILELSRSQSKQTNQASLFGAEIMPQTKLQLPKVEPATKHERLAWEKELLGMYVSAHPLEEYSEQLKKLAQPIKQAVEDGQIQTVFGGIVTRVQKILTKKGEQMAFLDLEDMSGTIEVVIFPNLFNAHKNLIAPEKLLIIKGRLSDKDGEPKFIADEIKEFPPELRLGETTIPTTPASVTIKIPESATDELFEQLKNLFESSPGDLNVNLMINEQKVKTPFKIELSEELKTKIKQVLGS
ncbi:MAG: DNA polymerase III subunit alpha [Candidatus Doudnabacteria bacterium RIFCSPLOWO2_01_FULL_44_21]|uniref:DNA polymerase III subunit alpha n=1 Tax=Candidatus Doudnabacteria bacterium RIFCSPLOWO2_01_FULL_44_21 TaxID=1817841 RepID=A0A1F5PXU7_9BACT|nr:MAG: DNA polymerase III subunit alpha [Candidatus Doudnabacteria bacterium RIFCSPHIGHO2_02_FULL_43_13b]OGE94733.1 MAG: DNA polymerase III subunit alpha [Candidatus Doudnabacteria bacterium RIFCSPLOWO2_01_FULL_44_21]